MGQGKKDENHKLFIHIYLLSSFFLLYKYLQLYFKGTTLTFPPLQDY